MNPSPVLIVRYSEIGLKGGNRSFFEKALVANLKHALRKEGHGPVERPHGRIIVRRPDDPEKAAAAAAEVFGVSSVSAGKSTGIDLDEITGAALVLIGEALDRISGSDRVPFRVESRRSDKSFPLNSMELSARIGASCLEAHNRLKVDLNEPAVTLGVEIRKDEAIVYSHRIEGPGGLPVGTAGKAVVLLSGGIDSPVAAWMTMKRGTRVVCINYHSYPFLPEESRIKVERIAKELSRFQRGLAVFFAPFADIQVAIKKECPEPLRTVLYRRMMLRLAERLALREGALAVVTGESLGQVASQTLENIRTIGGATRFPILRPLIGFDKTETIARARLIGTYDISIEPHPDCCTVFQPKKPKIKTTLEEAELAEKALDIDRLVGESFAGLDMVTHPDRTGS